MHANLAYSKVLSRLSVLTLFALMLGVIPANQAFAQEEAEEAASESSVESEEAAKDEPAEEEKDPYEIPADAGVKELFQYMDGLKRIRPTRSNMAETAKKVFPTIIKTADIILEKTDSDDDRQTAISRQFEAYGILKRFDPSVAGAAKELAEKYAESDSNKIASLAVGYLLNEKGNELRGASREMAEGVVEELLGFVDRFGANRNSFSTASNIARTLGYTEHTEVAADLYEKLSEKFGAAEDKQISERAASMMGAARRMRLPGNTMEVFGMTGAGEEFDWDSYKGKVVLVDFWASWCGPCIGELPNMKKNLAAYGDKGFEIVGINMDSTRQAFEKCVQDKEISWVNIVSEDKVGWQAPMAQHYGITGIPTAILVDQEGKVVSLRARGRELDRKLEELLGAAEEEEAEQKASPTALETID